jgi:O-antigen ligase
MKFETAIFMVIFIIPANLISEEFSAVLLGFLGILYLTKNRGKIKYFKELKYLYIIQIIIVLFAFLSLLHTSVLLQSLSEAFIYLDALIYFIIATNVKDKDKIIKAIVLAAALNSAFFSLYQGVYLDMRVSGTLGYANSYALLLLCALFLSETLEIDNYILFSKMSLMLGILFTGSRNTFFYLAVYLLLSLIKQKQNYIFRHSISVFIFDILIYTLFSLLGRGFIVLLLPMLYVYHQMLHIKVVNRKLIYSFISISLISVIAFCFLTNTGKRILNISLNSGVLQERLVMYEDSIKQIIHNPFGHGISTFQYRQFKDQSAFYDVKYIHNSILQISYDLGILPMLIFLFLNIYGIIKLLKAKNNLSYIILYVIIFLHSLLDFDFSYASIFIIPGVLIAFSQNNKETYKITLRPTLLIPAAAFFTAVLAFNLIFFMGNLSRFLGSDNTANLFYELYAKVSINDAAPFTALGTMALKNENFKQAEEYYLKARAENKEDPRILWNLAYAKEKNKKIDDALEYKEILLDYEKYNNKMYKFYYTSLKMQNLDTEPLKKTYYSNLNNLNPKARYMKNQLLNSFEEAVK